MEIIKPTLADISKIITGGSNFAANQLLECEDHFKSLGYTVMLPSRITDSAECANLVAFFKTSFESIEKSDLDDIYCVAKKTSNGKVIKFAAAFAVFEADKYLFGYIFNIRTDLQCTGQGLGTQFVEDFKAFVAGCGISKYQSAHLIVGMSKVLKPQKFFEKLGFKASLPSHIESWQQPGCEMAALELKVVADTSEVVVGGKKTSSKFAEETQIQAENSFGALESPKEEEKKDENDIQAAPAAGFIATNFSDSPYKSSPGGIGAPSAISAQTSRTTNRNADKHCLIDNCNGKKQAGACWRRHLKKLHHLVDKAIEGVHYVKCTGQTAHCFNEGSGYRGTHASRVCQQCQTNKRYDVFPSHNSVICNVCAKGKTNGKSKSVAAHPQAHELLSVSQLSEASLHQLQQGLALHPDDSISMVGVKRCHNKMEKLQPPTEVNYAEDAACIGNQDFDMDLADFVEPSPSKHQKCDSSSTAGQQKLFSVDPCHNSLTLSEISHSHKIVYVAHTDQQVVDLLIELEKNDATAQFECAQKLQKVCHLLSQEVVFNFLQKMKGTKLADIMIIVYGRSQVLNNQQLVGLTMASIALGNACWNGAVKMFTQKEVTTREVVLTSLEPHLQKIFSKETARWLSTYWNVTEQQHLDLMYYMSQKTTGVDFSVLMLSLVTTTLDIPRFVLFASTFVETAPARAELIFKSINRQTKQQKISFEELLQLTNLLQASTYSTALASISDYLATTQVHRWRDLIEAANIDTKITNSSSVQTFVDELVSAYGNITQLTGDATLQFQDFQILLNEAPLKPNDRQLALAQYCIGKLHSKVQRQLWVVLSGHGKSRIVASTAVLALISGSVTKVHIVFSCRHLMERDRKDFESYWLLLGYTEQQVQYHVGCEFKAENGDLIIIDEIDALMFVDPIKFATFINECLVLGFTATPDSCNPTGAENRIIGLLNFQKYYYAMDQQHQQENKPDFLVFDEIITCESVTLKANFIKKESASGPVIVYCDDSLWKALEIAGCDPLVVTENVDPELLRHSDKVLECGSYRILVVLDESMMRGYDYRSPNCRMTLMLGKSFQTLREAIQGYNRVGRFGDQCKRIRFHDTPLVDQQAQISNSGVLLRASLLLQKKPPQLKKFKVDKQATTASYLGGVSKLQNKRITALLGSRPMTQRMVSEPTNQ